MNFDFKKLRENLEPYKVEQHLKKRDCKGYLNVIHYVWTHTPTKMVNFDCFTLQDVYAALLEMEHIPLHWDDHNEYFVCDPTNDFLVFDSQYELFYGVTNAKEKKFVLEDDDMFL